MRIGDLVKEAFKFAKNPFKRGDSVRYHLFNQNLIDKLGTGSLDGVIVWSKVDAKPLFYTDFKGGQIYFVPVGSLEYVSHGGNTQDLLVKGDAMFKKFGGRLPT
jgi:hypothetical protein